MGRCIFLIKKWGGLGGKEGDHGFSKKENHKNLITHRLSADFLARKRVSVVQSLGIRKTRALNGN